MRSRLLAEWPWPTPGPTSYPVLPLLLRPGPSLARSENLPSSVSDAWGLSHATRSGGRAQAQQLRTGTRDLAPLPLSSSSRRRRFQARASRPARGLSGVHPPPARQEEGGGEREREGKGGREERERLVLPVSGGLNEHSPDHAYSPPCTSLARFGSRGHINFPRSRLHTSTQTPLVSRVSRGHHSCKRAGGSCGLPWAHLPSCKIRGLFLGKGLAQLLTSDRG